MSGNKPFDGPATLKRIIKRGRKVIAECESLINDANYWNGLPHNQKHTPFDVEPERLIRASMIKSVAQAEEQLKRYYPSEPMP